MPSFNISIIFFSILGVSVTLILVMSRDFLQLSLDARPATVNQNQIVMDLVETVYNNSSVSVDRISSADTKVLLDIKTTNHSIRYYETSEVHHIGFLKVHKAGSTTMQNMFFRFGMKRNLTFAIPRSGNYFSFHGSVPVKAGGHYDILAVHSVYRKDQYDATLPPDKVNIGIVREPLDRMISAAYYYRDVFGIPHLRSVPRTNFIQELIMHPEKYEKRPFSETKNSMGRDFGFEPTTKETDKSKILEKLEFLDREFKLVLVIERFEESLVLMKRYLNWKMSDIVFVESNSHKHAEDNLTEELKEKHKHTCFLDYAIYDYFSNVFDNKVKAEGNDFPGEVNHFKTTLKQTKSFCEQSKLPNDRLEFPSSQWSKEFVITHSDCEWMLMGEIKFINSLRARHIQMNGQH